MSPSVSGVYTVCILIPIVAIFAVAARFMVRNKKHAKLGSDDWTILVALVFLWVIDGIVIAGAAKGGFGHIIQDPGTLHPGTAEITEIKYETIIDWLLRLALGLIKLSVLLLYRRLFVVSSVFSKYSMVLCIITVLWSISFFFASLFQCGSRVSAIWTSFQDLLAFCDNTSAENVGFVVTDIILDILILTIPLPIVLRLQMSLAEKLGLCSVFALGFISTAGAVTRAVFMIRAQYVDPKIDVLDAETNLAVWGVVEMGAAIIGACLPPLRHLLGKSPGSIMHSIRSAFSLKSRHDSQRGDQNHDTEALTNAVFNLHTVRKSDSQGLRDSAEIGSFHVDKSS